MDTIANALLTIYFVACGIFGLYSASATSDKPRRVHNALPVFGFGLMVRVSTYRHPGTPFHEVLVTVGCGAFLAVAWIWLAKARPDSKVRRR